LKLSIVKDLLFGGSDYNNTRHDFKDASPYFYFIKKHYCKKCAELLTRKSENTIETNLDYNTILDSQMCGPTKLIRYYFYCSQCNIKYSTKELKELECLSRNGGVDT